MKCGGVCGETDPFLPRVVELAVSSTDRQTKVAACELLHSLLLYAVGRGAQQPGTQRQRTTLPMDAIYRKVFPALLRLATDVEQVGTHLDTSLFMRAMETDLSDLQKSL